MQDFNIIVEALDVAPDFDIPDQATRAPRELVGFIAAIAFAFACAGSFVAGVALSVVL